jgi:site-specific DNA recombinase
MKTEQYFIYARKSTDDADRQIRSIEDQLAEVRELIAKQGLTVADVFLEKQSAKKPGRPVFNAMMKRIENGDASGIIAWHPDRLARNMRDGGWIIDLFDTGVITNLKFPTVDIQPTSQGKLTLAMLFGMSKYYVDALSENIKRGQRQKVKNGIWPMVAPVGYVNDRKARVIVPDPERAPLIHKAFELYATGEYTLDRLSETMTGLGMTNGRGTRFKNRPLSRVQYSRILQNPIYYGTFCYSGEHYEGKHEPIISKALFDECQTVIERKSQPKELDRLKPYLYRGLFRCGECGCFITTETQKGHNYVHCTKRVKRDCSQPFMREEKVTEQIVAAIESAVVPDDWADWMIGELRAMQKEGAAASADVERAAHGRIAAVETKLDRLMTGYLDKLYGAEEYRDKKTRLLAEKQEAAETLATIVKNRSSRFEPEIRFVNALKQARIVVTDGNAEKQRDFFKEVGSNPKLVNRTLRFTPRNAWQTVVDQAPVAQHNIAPTHVGAMTVGKPSHVLHVAERGGFEPPNGFKPVTAFPVLLLRPLGHLSICRGAC